MNRGLINLVVLLATLHAAAAASNPLSSAAERFSDIDTNQDGTLSWDEYAAHESARLANRFRFMDADTNGLLTRLEFNGARGGTGTFEKVTGRMSASGHSPKSFEDVDTDGNAMLTLDELVASRRHAWRAHFRTLDWNGDGFVSKPEYLDVRPRRRR